MQLTNGRQKIVLAKALLKGSAREKFTNILVEMEVDKEMARDDDDPEDDEDMALEDRYQEAIEKLGLDYFPSAHSCTDANATTYATMSS